MEKIFNFIGIVLMNKSVNKIFEEWIIEWKNDAIARNSNLKYSYIRVCKFISLKKFNSNNVFKKSV